MAGVRASIYSTVVDIRTSPLLNSHAHITQSEFTNLLR